MCSMDISDLYTKHYNRLLHISYAIVKDMQLAEDVVQETFIKVLLNMDTIQEEEKVSAWLSVITNHAAIDMLRKVKSNKGIPTEQELLVNMKMEETPNVEDEVAYYLLLKEVKQEIRSLNSSYRDVMILKMKYDLKEREIADQLNIKLSSVKTRIHRARKQLKAQYEKRISA
ncbi:RNA polymerase sigma factor [Ornithinibacillus sp. 179-J 7C1 HS]|uniref:RNA polymerase sigma factor n=1 Tax=Ornithinibacillus sp. 179-J 7C1 HS TaxID=3142384 RepID=UPI0039A0288D